MTARRGRPLVHHPWSTALRGAGCHGWALQGREHSARLHGGYWCPPHLSFCPAGLQHTRIPGGNKEGVWPRVTPATNGGSPCLPLPLCERLLGFLPDSLPLASERARTDSYKALTPSREGFYSTSLLCSRGRAPRGLVTWVPILVLGGTTASQT